ncbi:MAG TPA: tRNA lysidine(34) synthetase TilS, partial [Burkholderiales bacterium]|nr:tRNA lysidine(34) synthetase TilS [Burkholderiales bacterium]
MRSSAAGALLTHVAARMKPVVQPGERVLVGLSGGIDSVVLLDILARLETRLGVKLWALHVDHGLNPKSREWARFCRALCRSRGVPLRVVRVKLERANSVERAAREARYAALRATRAQLIALAHNQDDQAETVLLQLLRGAGVKGLSAMPFARREAGAAGARSPSIVRPLLDVPRSEIESYAKRRKLEWVEDDSNSDARYTRNWVRHEVLPGIEARVPAYREVLSRTARNLADAAALLDDLAGLDAARALRGDALSVDELCALTPARGRNLLRFLMAERGLRMPYADRLDEALRQATRARRDARLSVNLGECELRRHRDLIYLVPARAAGPAGDAVTWHGEREIALPSAGGVLTMVRGHGKGISAARLDGAPVTIRTRQGGERLQTQAKGPRRTVKNLLQEAGIPPWQRERLPFIYCGEALACVP